MLKMALMVFLQIFGQSPQPFGYFCVASKEQHVVSPGAKGKLVMRLLPLCCGTMSMDVPLSVFPPKETDIPTLAPLSDAAGAPAANGCEEQLRLVFPLCIEVFGPRVSHFWPPQIDFGMVSLLVAFYLILT